MFQVVHNHWAPVGPFIQTVKAFSDKLKACRHLRDLDAGDAAYVYDVKRCKGIELPEALELIQQELDEIQRAMDALPKDQREMVMAELRKLCKK